MVNLSTGAHDEGYESETSEDSDFPRDPISLATSEEAQAEQAAVEYLSDEEIEEITDKFRFGIRNFTSSIAKGLLRVTGVATVGLLTAAGFAPVIIPALKGALSMDVLSGWLTGLGANALATWITEWCDGTIAVGDTEQEKDERKIVRDLSTSLTKKTQTDTAVAENVALLLRKVDVLAMAFKSLDGNTEVQKELARKLQQDLGQKTVLSKLLASEIEELTTKHAPDLQSDSQDLLDDLLSQTLKS